MANGSNQTISIPFKKRETVAYFGGVFILFWLGGWAFGEIFAIRNLIAGTPTGGTAFLVFWLGAWTVGGIYAMLTVRRIFQRSVPEVISLEVGGLLYDSGIPPFQMPARREFVSWRDAFPKRAKIRIDRRELETLRLREGDAANRLTIDAGAERIELAKAATDVEREWLWQILCERYGLKPGQ